MDIYDRFVYNTGLPHSQEKSGNQEKLRKMTKVRKSQVKMGIFEKSQKQNFLKHQIF